uniref:LRRCT domain-containing protein n=1 Tax=Monopterus albus TaxID=43700 RepID=A0A3Q3KQG7_MONAL
NCGQQIPSCLLVYLYFTLWIATVFTTGLGCPELCTCSDKYGHHFAECSYKDLAEVPDGLPPNVTTVSLSANKISLISSGCFDNVTKVISLWLAHNEIISIEQGAFALLVHLALHLLKMNHNEMVHLPRDTFSNLKDLRSLQLNNNKFITIAEGTFDGLVSLSHLQIHNNPYACTCLLDWLRDWISTTTISVPEVNLIICATPEKLKGQMIKKLPESKCTCPNVTIRTEPNIHNTTFYEDSRLCGEHFEGNHGYTQIMSKSGRSQEVEIVLTITRAAQFLIILFKLYKILDILNAHLNPDLHKIHLEIDNHEIASLPYLSKFSTSAELKKK